MSFRTYRGNSRSENGWRICNRDECELPAGPEYPNTAQGNTYRRQYGASVTATAPVRNGATLVIMSALIDAYHREFQPIVHPIWGWSRDNDVANSNHLSGTACFAADTEIITADGPRKIGDLAGTMATILTADPFAGGVAQWVEAPISSFGYQDTRVITLTKNGRRKTLRATDDHRWFVRRVKRIEYRENGNRRTAQRERVEEVTTAELQPGDALVTARPRREAARCEPAPIGVAAGIVFGDGSVNSTSRPRSGSVVDLIGAKRELLQFFPRPRTHALDDDRLRVDNLPRRFKTRLPDMEESTGYLLGWLAGMVATDGEVSEAGSVSLTTAREDVAEFVRSICPRLGIGAHVTSRKRGPDAYAPGVDFRISFDRSSLDSAFFVRSDQREAFGTPTRGPLRWTVKGVSDGLSEEVFCASVEGTRTFMLDEFILTGNCDINAPNWPWQQRRMSGAQRAKIREIVARFDGAVFWGGEWSRVDEMHFQIGRGEGDRVIDDVAARLAGAPPAPERPAPAGGRPVLRRGSTGPAVQELQTFFNRVYPAYSRLATDGDFGPATEAVVREFQRRAGLHIDGVVGRDTWARLGFR